MASEINNTGTSESNPKTYQSDQQSMANNGKRGLPRYVYPIIAIVIVIAVAGIYILIPAGTPKHNTTVPNGSQNVSTSQNQNAMSPQQTLKGYLGEYNSLNNVTLEYDLMYVPSNSTTSNTTTSGPYTIYLYRKNSSTQRATIFNNAMGSVSEYIEHGKFIECGTQSPSSVSGCFVGVSFSPLLLFMTLNESATPRNLSVTYLENMTVSGNVTYSYLGNMTVLGRKCGSFRIKVANKTSHISSGISSITTLNDEVCLDNQYGYLSYANLTTTVIYLYPNGTMVPYFAPGSSVYILKNISSTLNPNEFNVPTPFGLGGRSNCIQHAAAMNFTPFQPFSNPNATIKIRPDIYNSLSQNVSINETLRGNFNPFNTYSINITSQNVNLSYTSILYLCIGGHCSYGSQCYVNT